MPFLLNRSNGRQPCHPREHPSIGKIQVSKNASSIGFVHGITYSAASAATTRENTINIGAWGVNVTSDLNIEAELGTAGRLVEEDGQEGSAVSHSNTNVHRSPVTCTLRIDRRVPEAGVRAAISCLVDIVLSRGGLTLPVVVGGRVGVGELDSLSGVSDGRNGHALGTRVIGSAS